MSREQPGATLREQVGQLIIAGVEGTTLTAVERAWLKLIRPGGVILFRRNIDESLQVTSLLREATEIAGAPLFRCVDVEGGLVDRLRDLIAPMPSSAAVFATGKRANFKKHGRLIGQAVRALGFNATFAPVLDLGLPVSAAVMRTRVVSPDPEQVIVYAAAFLDGLAMERVLGCGKHFPGLGGGTLDSHEAMPVIERSWEQIWSEDLAPYRALADRLPLVMISHASYPRASAGAVPASISSYWIKDVLRKRIGFGGLVVSDDMEMGGILTQASMEEAAVAAVLAGTDLIEICKDPALVIRAYEALLSEAERSTAFRRRVQTAWRKITQCKQAWLDAAMPRSASAARIAALRETVREFASSVKLG
jgi:beta-N-acetylhexosaminidase